MLPGSPTDSSKSLKNTKSIIVFTDLLFINVCLIAFVLALLCYVCCILECICFVGVLCAVLYEFYVCCVVYECYVCMLCCVVYECYV